MNDTIALNSWSQKQQLKRRGYAEDYAVKQPRMRYPAAERFKWRQSVKYYANRGIGIAETRTVRHINTIDGNYSFELNWGQAKGSKLRAYRFARQFASANNGQRCACPMASPKGFLP